VRAQKTVGFSYLNQSKPGVALAHFVAAHRQQRWLQLCPITI